MTYTEAWNKIVGYKTERNGMDYEQAYRQTKAEFQKSEEYSHPHIIGLRLRCMSEFD